MEASASSGVSATSSFPFTGTAGPTTALSTCNGLSMLNETLS
jgi:hypothetical protein